MFFSTPVAMATYDTVKTVKIKACTATDEEAEQPPAAPGTRTPPGNQHDDQGEQELADENIEVQPGKRA